MGLSGLACQSPAFPTARWCSTSMLRHYSWWSMPALARSCLVRYPANCTHTTPSHYHLTFHHSMLVISDLLTNAGLASWTRTPGCASCTHTTPSHFTIAMPVCTDLQMNNSVHHHVASVTLHHGNACFCSSADHHWCSLSCCKLSKDTCMRPACHLHHVEHAMTGRDALLSHVQLMTYAQIQLDLDEAGDMR